MLQLTVNFWPCGRSGWIVALQLPSELWSLAVRTNVTVDHDIVGSLVSDRAQEVRLHLVGVGDRAGVDGLRVLGRVPAITHYLRQLPGLSRIRDLALQVSRAFEVDLAVDLQGFIAQRA